MTDRLRRERELPKGYQFGDARGVSNNLSIRFVRQFDIVTDHRPARFPCEWPQHWNVIEGEHKTTHIGFDPASKRTWEP